MTKPNLVLGFADTFQNCERFFTDILSQDYNIIRDDNNPDYLIFGDPNFGQNHHRFDSRQVKKIFFTGENVRPSYFNHDYAITFDFENSPRHYRLPLYVMEMWAIVSDDNYTTDYLYLKDLHSRVDWEKVYDETPNGFTYIQSNPNCMTRTNFVQDMMRNFDVRCGGPHLNNIGHIIPRDRKLKIEFLKSRKFNIAFENGSYPGYVTEKILDAFYANVMPVYWGSTMIGRDFNTACFIHLKDDELYRGGGICRTVMNDKDLWCTLMSQPRFNYNIPNEYTQLQNFRIWFRENVYKVK